MLVYAKSNGEWRLLVTCWPGHKKEGRGKSLGHEESESRIQCQSVSFTVNLSERQPIGARRGRRVDLSPFSLFLTASLARFSSALQLPFTRETRCTTSTAALVCFSSSRLTFQQLSLCVCVLSLALSLTSLLQVLYLVSRREYIFVSIFHRHSSHNLTRDKYFASSKNEIYFIFLRLTFHFFPSSTE